jgi:hypothetical protein
MTNALYIHKTPAILWNNHILEMPGEERVVATPNYPKFLEIVGEHMRQHPTLALRNEVSQRCQDEGLFKRNVPHSDIEMMLVYAQLANSGQMAFDFPRADEGEAIYVCGVPENGQWKELAYDIPSEGIRFRTGDKAHFYDSLRRAVGHCPELPLRNQVPENTLFDSAIPLNNTAMMRVYRYLATHNN